MSEILHFGSWGRVFSPAQRVLGMRDRSAALPAGEGTLLAYGVGHCGVIVAAGTSTERVQRFLNWNDQTKGVAVLKVACGVLVLLGGVWFIYTSP